MNKLALLSIGLLLPAAASAAGSSEADYLAKAKKGPGIPVPVSVTAPEVSRIADGETAEITLIVTRSGRAADVSVKSASDRDLGFAARDAVKRWRFEPAMIDGRPVDMRVVVPFYVRAADSGNAAFAANR